MKVKDVDDFDENYRQTYFVSRHACARIGASRSSLLFPVTFPDTHRHTDIRTTRTLSHRITTFNSVVTKKMKAESAAQTMISASSTEIFADNSIFKVSINNAQFA